MPFLKVFTLKTIANMKGVYYEIFIKKVFGRICRDND